MHLVRNLFSRRYMVETKQDVHRGITTTAEMIARLGLGRVTQRQNTNSREDSTIMTLSPTITLMDSPLALGGGKGRSFAGRIFIPQERYQCQLSMD